MLKRDLAMVGAETRGHSTSLESLDSHHCNGDRNRSLMSRLPFELAVLAQTFSLLGLKWWAKRSIAPQRGRWHSRDMRHRS